MSEIGRWLVIMGLGLAAFGLVLWLAGRVGFGGLPGDIVIRRGNFTFFFPLASSLVLSLLLTLVLNLLFRGR
ncbi:MULTISPECIES: DUF2905 domain-containing protein [Thermaerobacter]|uniref:DUF2905 domain-containing protein n=1 Tax=Thermaerobacter composti TaxID=554949 RepID=A0ABZ0QQS3_9FIRM|nr:MULTISPECIES: DUF2905 domain-containing protein [Thermaerobacter]WPD19856.1 DUF2905 domain-containing protein [Thermaerobacter composti]